MEFNADGSIKLPENILRQKQEQNQKMRTQRAIKVLKEIVSDRSPKKCVLHISLSEALHDNKFMETIHEYFKNNSEVPTKLTKVNEKEFEVEIGTCFKRCTDCCTLIREYKEFLSGNVIVESGSCTFGDRSRNFAPEDYFD